ncbi:FAD-dependent oxidoreductase [Seohaeicola zhoushanensis]|uniref:Dehydrogenase n=1 Tax=Seohaeicola zhoushanensis TaxID=1569283 RepID=A0A8J3H0U5_9RHOB|nr:FAD-dependent oxidoreductase [Seohaeicola zhoushanensis]GHF62145.1 dehydrogenase [Seohaeicola zhoushanensis]
MKDFDAIVIGSGVSGLTTAIVAAQQGLKVLVIEKAPVFGGTTAYSGGVGWIPNNHLMHEAGLDDSREKAETYLRAVLGNHYDPEMIDAFLDNGPRMLKHMMDTTELDFVVTPTPDYEPDKPSAYHSRGVLAKEYDGTRLGKHLDLLRRPLDTLTVLGGMQVAGADITPLRTAFQTPASFGYTTRTVARYARQKATHGRATRLVSGNALAARLLKSALDAGVTLWNETPALELLKTGGRITGVKARHKGQEIVLTARKAVVLASGGFGASEGMRKEFMPNPEHHRSIQPSENVGDGARMGEAVGGRMARDNPSNAIFIPISEHREADGTVKRFPHIMIDRYMPGSIAVDETGQRFVNEGLSYQHYVTTMHARNMTRSYLIGDRRFLRKYGMGLVRPFPYPIGKWLKNGYLTEGATLQDLARKIGVDPAGLQDTVERFNGFARKGADADFGRGADAHSRYRGDQTVKPNPSLAPLETGPFYAITLYPGDLSSVAGLVTDGRTRVLDEAGKPIAGLYAVGLDMNSMTKGMYPAGGSSLGPGLTFGYIAGNEIAAAE